jgi:hypothetical protein
MSTDSKLPEIRRRTEKQQSRYGFRWNHLLRDRRDLLAIVDAKQARIDALMLEFCPDEMDAEQRAEWANHQKPVDKRTALAIRKASLSVTERNLCSANKQR